MVRVNNRARKAKPSKKSKICRRQYLQTQKFSERKGYVEKEKTTEETIAFLQKELKDSRNENHTVREEKKKVRIDMRNEQKGLPSAREE